MVPTSRDFSNASTSAHQSRTMPFRPSPRHTRENPCRRAMRSTLEREQCHRTASSFGAMKSTGRCDGAVGDRSPRARRCSNGTLETLNHSASASSTRWMSSELDQNRSKLAQSFSGGRWGEIDLIATVVMLDAISQIRPDMRILHLGAQQSSQRVNFDVNGVTASYFDIPPNRFPNLLCGRVRIGGIS